MNRQDLSGHYPIREFSRLTGVTAATLRAWERRYGIIQPERTPKGHRFYKDEHVKLVNTILYWLDQGYPIRQVKLLLKSKDTDIGSNSSNWLSQQQLMYEAAINIKPQALENIWRQGLSNYPITIYHQHCLLPVINKLQQNREEQLVLKIFIYLFKRKLQSLIRQQQKQNQGQPLLLACNHKPAELDILLLAYGLGAAAFRVEFFGSGIKPLDINLLADTLQAESIWLHLYPDAAGDNQLWLQHLCQQTRHQYFLSGHLPDDFPSDTSNISIMPNELSKQIKLYITQNSSSKAEAL